VGDLALRPPAHQKGSFFTAFLFNVYSVLEEHVTRYFTLKEANEALPVIRPLLQEMMQIGDKIREHQPELWAAVEKSAGNGGNPTLSKLLRDFDRLDALLHQIQDMGIKVKDLQVGLVDFPAWHEDHEVYLCWQYGEQDIQFWHEIEAGFAGRQTIDWDQPI
jgi:hypothetical protein